MIPIEFLSTTREAASLIKEGEIDKAVQMLDGLSHNMPDLIPSMGVSDRMEVLGNIALRYREAGATEKETVLLEQLCELAEQDIAQLGIMASSEDLARTATDFLVLGVAYLKTNRKDEACDMLAKAQKLFAEIDWEIDVDEMTAGKRTYIGPRGGRDQVLGQLGNAAASYKRPVLLSFNFQDGGRCYVYYP